MAGDTKYLCTQTPFIKVSVLLMSQTHVSIGTHVHTHTEICTCTHTVLKINKLIQMFKKNKIKFIQMFHKVKDEK